MRETIEEISPASSTAGPGSSRPQPQEQKRFFLLGFRVWLLRHAWAVLADRFLRPRSGRWPQSLLFAWGPSLLLATVAIGLAIFSGGDPAFLQLGVVAVVLLCLTQGFLAAISLAAFISIFPLVLASPEWSDSPFIKHWSPQEGLVLFLVSSCTAAIVSALAASREHLKAAHSELEHHAQSLADLAGHDVLTGLSSRVHFYESLYRALGERNHGGYSLALLALDVDNLKPVNDRYGHAAGDAYLCEVARIIAACTRPGDVAARVGGDEFLVLMHHMDVEGAWKIAQKIRGSIERADLPGAFQGSISIGVAMTGGLKMDPERLVHAADEALYRAKREGGNTLRLTVPSESVQGLRQVDALYLLPWEEAQSPNGGRVWSDGTRLLNRGRFPMTPGRHAQGERWRDLVSPPITDPAVPLPSEIDLSGLSGVLRWPAPKELRGRTIALLAMSLLFTLWAWWSFSHVVVEASRWPWGQLLLLAMLVVFNESLSPPSYFGRPLNLTFLVIWYAIFSSQSTFVVPLVLVAVATRTISWQRKRWFDAFCQATVLVISFSISSALWNADMGLARDGGPGALFWPVIVFLFFCAANIVATWLLSWTLDPNDRPGRPVQGIIGRQLLAAGTAYVAVLLAGLLEVPWLKDLAPPVAFAGLILTLGIAERRRREIEGILTRLTGAVEMKDRYTHDHLHTVRAYAMAIGLHLRLSESVINQLGVAAMLHDIGKLGISKSSLEKAGPLTRDEQDEIRSHPIIGEALLRTLPWCEAASLVAASHHERWDGSGYPLGLRGDTIPLAGRIVAVADSFDAMTSVRPYRDSQNPNGALEEIISAAGFLYDPFVVNAFTAALRSGTIGRLLHGGSRLPHLTMVT